MLHVGNPGPERAALLEKLRRKMLASISDDVVENAVSKSELLALLAYTTGQCIAFQDQTKWNSDEVLTFVTLNITSGNKAAIEDLAKAPANTRLI